VALKTYSGSCHCGAGRFQADIDLNEGTNKLSAVFQEEATDSEELWRTQIERFWLHGLIYLMESRTRVDRADSSRWRPSALPVLVDARRWVLQGCLSLSLRG
jgi:hypothetical protein